MYIIYGKHWLVDGYHSDTDLTKSALCGVLMEAEGNDYQLFSK